jgi:hypothetical protein
MDLMEILPESIQGKEQKNLYFLTGTNIAEKTCNAEAVRAGFSSENVFFTTENTKSHDLADKQYMCSDELLYRSRNTGYSIQYHEKPRSKNFTALVRTHKLWRANTMARLWSKGLHERGYFSYNNKIVNENDVNCIDIDRFGSLKHHTEFFLKLCPFHADLLTSDQHTEMERTVNVHHDDAYFNFVIESELTGPVRLTEKVFKAIKHCQPFVIAGPRGSVQQLRDMGYKTFDYVIDHSYDTIEDHTERWDAVSNEMCRLAKSKKAHTMYTDCKQDLLYNQELFLNRESETILICLK